MHYPARAIVDLDAIRLNAAEIVRRFAPARFMAIVKADGYGHGLLPAAIAAIQGGAHWLGDAQVGEAIALRDGLDAAGIDRGRAPILAWMYNATAPLGDAIARDVDLGVGHPAHLAQIAAAAEAVGKPARLHLKVDTGMSRNGATLADWDDLVRDALALERRGLAAVTAIWSHFACADIPGDPATPMQLANFHEAVHRARALGAEPELLHLANSPATMTMPETRFDLVRPGILLYGLPPDPEFVQHMGDLRPAMRLEADLINVKRVEAGAGVSYGLTYRTPRATTLGLVPVGYGDGIPRAAANKGAVAFAGGVFPVAGKVCMDQFVVDLGPGAAASVGDTVTIYGTRPGEPTVTDWAAASGTVNYELITQLGPRVPRIYRGERPTK